MPSVARPFDTMSSAVMVFANSVGWRYVLPVTSADSRTVLVCCAKADNNE